MIVAGAACRRITDHRRDPSGCHRTTPIDAIGRQRGRNQWLFGSSESGNDARMDLPIDFVAIGCGRARSSAIVPPLVSIPDYPWDEIDAD